MPDLSEKIRTNQDENQTWSGSQSSIQLEAFSFKVPKKTFGWRSQGNRRGGKFFFAYERLMCFSQVYRLHYESVIKMREKRNRL